MRHGLFKKSLRVFQKIKLDPQHVVHRSEDFLNRQGQGCIKGFGVYGGFSAHPRTCLGEAHGRVWGSLGLKGFRAFGV